MQKGYNVTQISVLNFAIKDKTAMKMRSDVSLMHDSRITCVLLKYK